MLDQDAVARVRLCEKWKELYRETLSKEAHELFKTFDRMCQSCTLSQLRAFDAIAHIYATYCDGNPQTAKDPSVALQFALDRYGIASKARNWPIFYSRGLEMKAAYVFLLFLFPADKRRRLKVENFLHEEADNLRIHQF